MGRDDESNMIIERGSGQEAFQLLNVLEFNSTRKRMSVIVKNKQGQIKLLCKGADSVIKDRLDSKNQGNLELFRKTDFHLQEYAKSGLRTLLIAERVLSPETYLEW